jgi:DNA-binding LacI/PurR family transcriptional regulator
VRGARAATAHLAALGHRHIALITNAPLAYTASTQRLQGYRQALAEARLPYDDSLVEQGNFDEESGRAAMARLLTRPVRPTAVFVASDMVAMGALRALREADLRVPEDVAVVGFDDIAAPPATWPTTYGCSARWKGSSLRTTQVAGPALLMSPLMPSMRPLIVPQ